MDSAQKEEVLASSPLQILETHRPSIHHHYEFFFFFLSFLPKKFCFLYHSRPLFFTIHAYFSVSCGGLARPYMIAFVMLLSYEITIIIFVTAIIAG
jgi:hypothetical protein